jgi:hypothetical protein
MSADPSALRIIELPVWDRVWRQTGRPDISVGGGFIAGQRFPAGCPCVGVGCTGKIAADSATGTIKEEQKHIYYRRDYSDSSPSGFSSWQEEGQEDVIYEWTFDKIESAFRFRSKHEATQQWGCWPNIRIALVGAPGAPTLDFYTIGPFWYIPELEPLVDARPYRLQSTRVIEDDTNPQWPEDAPATAVGIYKRTIKKTSWVYSVRYAALPELL